MAAFRSGQADDTSAEHLAHQVRAVQINDDASVWPGTTTEWAQFHDRPERATNPFLRCPDLAAFLALKRDWPAVKERLGLK